MNIFKKIISRPSRLLTVVGSLWIATSALASVSGMSVSAYWSEPLLPNSDEITISRSYNGELVMNLLDNDMYMKEADFKEVSYDSLESWEYRVNYLWNHSSVSVRKGKAYIDVSWLSNGLNVLGEYELCKDTVLVIPWEKVPVVMDENGVIGSGGTIVYIEMPDTIITVPNCAVASIFVNVEDDATPKLPEQPRTPSSPSVPSSGPGGYVEGQPIFPFQPIDGVTLFSAPKEKMQCVSPVKNLDDPKLIEYYNGLKLGFEGDFHRALTRSEFVKMIIRSADVKKDEVSLDILDNFIDINKDSENAIYIAYALERGIISGQVVSEENGIIKRSFRPDDSISRAEASKIFSGLILKNLDELPTSEKISTFSDVDKKNTLGAYIQYSYDNCLLHGRKTRDGQPIAGQPRVFEPFDGITIAETAKVLYNMTHATEE